MTLLTESIRPPSKLLWAAELPRAAWTVMNLPRHKTLLRGEQTGDGRPVMLLPGLMQGERAFSRCNASCGNGATRRTAGVWAATLARERPALRPNS